MFHHCNHPIVRPLWTYWTATVVFVTWHLLAANSKLVENFQPSSRGGRSWRIIFWVCQIGLSPENSKKFRGGGGATHILVSTTVMFDRFQLTGKYQTDLSYLSWTKVFQLFHFTRFDVLLVNKWPLSGTLGMVLNSVLNQQKSTKSVPEFYTVKYRPLLDAFFRGLKAEWKTRPTDKACMVSTPSKEELMAIACSLRIYNGQVDRWSEGLTREEDF